MVRGSCIPVVRMNDRTASLGTQGVMVVVHKDGKEAGILVDAIIGEQQVVVKALPKYVKRVQGIAGCTLLGDGSISLIVDVSQLVDKGGLYK